MALAQGSDKAISVKVCFFAGAREQVGIADTQLELAAGAGTSQFVQELVALYPQLESLLPRCALAINGDYVRSETPLVAGDEVAVLPPMSGG